MQHTNDAPLLAHVLFMDIVGATKLPTDEQRRILSRLRELVRASEEFQCAKESNQLISVPTGDGMALAFFNRLDAAVLCAVEITKAIQAESLCKIRMGVHTGPVFVEEDIRGQPNLNGAGINLAERVMSAGGDGHILVSETVAASLKQLGNWRGKIHEIGECQVKDGWIRVWNLVDGPIGNAATPKKAKALIMRRRWMLAGAFAALVLIVAAAAGSGALWFERTGSKPPEDQASIAVIPFTDMSPQKNQE
ncbi:MAG TPA: adenylate/guanylate cyclase domain-containing protein, partial [Bryobacteraceae bacterium]|nr:adenylate/guanylate cyclase domain-containing protein [Bryobacteraceae bacterium]